MIFLRTLDSAIGTRKMFLGYSALRRDCAERIRGTCTPKNAIDKTRYLRGPFRLIRAFRTRSARIWLYRGRQLTESPQISARSPEHTCSRFVTKNFRIRIFKIPRNFSEKVIFGPKRAFLTFRGTCGPQEDPTGTWECSHWICHRVPRNFMCSVVT